MVSDAATLNYTLYSNEDVTNAGMYPAISIEQQGGKGGEGHNGCLIVLVLSVGMSLTSI